MRQTQRFGATRAPIYPWRYMTQAMLVCATLAIGACGTTTTTKVAQHPKAATATTRAQPTATTAGSTSSAPIVLPYTFASNWQYPATNGPQSIGGYAFAPSAPLVGYACKSFAGNATTAYVPSAAGTPASARSLALGVSPSAPRSGLPEVSVTTDGGDSWQGTRTAPIPGDGPCNVMINPNDPKDVFVSSGTNNPKQANALVRSQDGGATWSTLSNISVQGQQLYVSHLALLGTRLLASVQQLCTSNVGCATPPLTDNLFASDDGGMTWQQIGQKVAGAGAQLSPFVTAGATLFIASQGTTSAATGTRPTLSSPLSSPTTTTYWRSSDAGSTWTRMSPQPPLPLLTFAPVPQTTGYYSALSGGTSNGRVATQFFVSSGTSATVGTSWNEAQSLDGDHPSNPTYAGVSGQPGSFSFLLTADGSILTSTVYLDPKTGSYADGGTFLLSGSTAPSNWRALAPPGVFNWQTTPRGSGFRLWGITYGTATQPSSLVYVDVG